MSSRNDSQKVVKSLPSSRLPPARVVPILDDDLREVGLFLSAHFPPDTSGEDWGRAWSETVNLTESGAPNHGFMLKAGGKVVGAYPAIYSTRVIEGRLERFCNLAVWCVQPEYRMQSIRMLQAAIAQKDYHFTDLTPIETVQKLNIRLGFQYLDTTTLLIPNLPWPTWNGTVVTADPDTIAATVTGDVSTFYRDHASCRWAKHLLLKRSNEWCYIQWRKESKKNLPLFASIRYVSNPEMLRREFRSLARYFLLRHMTPFSLVELRILGGRINPSIVFPRPARRMFKSESLHDGHIDYLYSEISSAP
jgi:hypothetical protein